MVLKRFNNWVIVFVILCSVSLYRISALGNLRTGFELLGVGVIIISLILSLVYSDYRPDKQQFKFPIFLILISLVTSMITVYYTRDQSVAQTLLAQMAIYYYLLYFLLHRLNIKIKDIERIFIGFGIVYVVLFFLQTIIYPTVIFDAYVRSMRGTIRIYLPGTDYMFISFFIGIQYFFRTNKIWYLLFSLLIMSVFILTGGRQTMATVALVVVLFLVFDKKIKSRMLIAFLGLISAFALFILFQGIFEAIFQQSRYDIGLGENYIRLRAAEYYLTDFFKHPIAYVTGNGMYDLDSNYGKEIMYDRTFRRYYLGDIGLIGNYAIYGLFFVLGVLIICFKSLFIRVEMDYTYIKLMFITMILSLIIAGGFANSDTICFAMLMLYMIDKSNVVRSATEES